MSEKYIFDFQTKPIIPSISVEKSDSPKNVHFTHNARTILRNPARPSMGPLHSTIIGDLDIDVVGILFNISTRF